ncbi:MAG: FAD-dependent oxidoreductase [Aquificaceae bacterium]|nr:FAD-dependent oxidoreductase [Aquificaceae bacterium]
MTRVLIVGAGASGLSCAVCLLSSKGRGFDWADLVEVLLVDNGRSDLNRAFIKNAPAIEQISGVDILERMKTQVYALGGKILTGKVVKIIRENSQFFVELEDGREFISDFVVLASGFHRFDIQGLNVELLDNPMSPKPGRVMIKHSNFLVSKRLYVAGTLAGISSHFTSCAGSGFEVASIIMKELAGKPVVIHDVPEAP